MSADDEIITDFGAHLSTLLEGSEWTLEGSADTPWCHAEPSDAPALPTQGWKLHLSASVHTATTVLERAVPVLVATATSFKVASTLQMLVTLNQGQAGSSQIGKFMTVYPVDDSSAVSVARQLDEMLADLAGPTVPSDRALREGGVVRYRYGGFSARWMQLPSGEVTPVLETPTGELVPDTRSFRDAVPEWVTDPFEAADLVHPPSTPPVLIADRFRPVTTIHRSPNSAVFLAVDLKDLQRCVLKRAVIDDDPWGAAARLVHEHSMLVALADVPGVVDAIGWFDDGNERALALEDIPGSSPSMLGSEYSDRAFTLPTNLVADIGRKLASIVAELHRRNIVHRDIKPTNLILQADGTARLIDLELAAFADHTMARGYGTLGYLSPEQARREAPDPADDVYSIGATMFSLAIGNDISNRPVGVRPTLDGLVLDMPASLASVIERCLAPTRAERYADADEVVAALDALDASATPPIPPYGSLGTVPTDPSGAALEVVHRLTDSLVADAISTPTGTTWTSRHPATSGLPARDVNTGAAGTLLATIACARALELPGAHELIASAAAWLDAAPRLEGALLGGLYVGESGVASALLRAGQFLGDDALVASALRRSRDAAVLPHGSPDLFNGSAGRLRAHLWLAQATGDSDALDAGLAAGRHLVSTADRPAAGRATWTVLPEFGGGQQLGYAHGAAGIADTLLDLAEYTGDDTFSATALDAARWLIDQATQYDDGSVTFPSEFGGRNWSPLWCHGAAGIGRFLVHLHRSGHLADADQWLLGATGIAVARHGRTLGPVMCHGLAGSIDHLLDLHQIEPSGEHLREAWSLAGRLRDFHVEGNDGHLRALSDHPGVTTPDLTVGYAGIAALWLRLADPSKPTLLAGQPDAFWI